jgi:molybdopterin-guanine dinucleotide biosynthesis protein A
MGRDKTQLPVGGTTLARRTGQLLARVATTALEVGPGTSGLTAVSEDLPGRGPLSAIAAGRVALRESGHVGSALVVACDLPLVSEKWLRYLLHYDSGSSVVPIVDGRAQPLCAKWGADDLDAAVQLVREGERSLRHLLNAPGVILLEESRWSRVVTRENFDDVDTIEDARRLGLLP